MSLELMPKWRRPILVFVQVLLVQIAVPSRTDVSEYQKLRLVPFLAQTIHLEHFYRIC
jgi:trehalose-6-phosphate synthase